MEKEKIQWERGAKQIIFPINPGFFTAWETEIDKIRTYYELPKYSVVGFTYEEVKKDKELSKTAYVFIEK